MPRIGLRIVAACTLAACPGAPALHAQSVSETAGQVGKSAQTIVTKPLKDANVVKSEIPPELLAVMDNPYSLKGVSTCAQFSAEIARMTRVLGPDVDARGSSKGKSASEQMLDEVEKVAGGLVPGSGIMRKVSGAEAQEKKAKAAVYAGSLRRAYLKGAARAKGCKV